MIVIKTYIGDSKIHGTGLFASEFISKGTLIWKLNPDFDLVLSNKEFENLPTLTQNFITHFSHFDKVLNRHILCSDHARFFKKPETPNCGVDALGNQVLYSQEKKAHEL